MRRAICGEGPEFEVEEGKARFQGSGFAFWG